MISNKYFDYLKHFRQTATVARLHASRCRANVIALRHDVDYDLDLALELAYWEHRNGFQSTYYVLHTAEYWQDPRLIDKLLQIQDFGHEIGLHLNVISEWFNGITDDPKQRLNDMFAMLREAGLSISGCSGHGDKLCYRVQFINHWLFEELRPYNPLMTENGLSAEGIKVDNPNFQIAYPETHYITRANGDKLPLWSISMRDVGLTYHAAHVQSDRYFSDSGGEWQRSPNPINEDLSTGKHQILIHPEYWQGPQRIYFFLSTARCGTKWLTSVLEKATPLMAKHEHALNYYYHEDRWCYDHKTGSGFVGLQNDKKEVRKLLLDLRTWIQEQESDYAEVNVYLENFVLLLAEIFPDATFIHLFRNPADVVRSIINRDWYATPRDDKHPVVHVAGWNRMSQFEKACWYVRDVNERLMPLDAKLSFDELVSDFSYLEKYMHNLNIPFYPRLATEVFEQKTNQNTVNDFPAYASWPERVRSQYHAIHEGVINKKANFGTKWSNRLMSLPRLFGISKNKSMAFQECLAKPNTRKERCQISKYDFSEKPPFYTVSHQSCKLELTDQGLLVTPEHGLNAHVLLGGGKWDQAGKRTGWNPKPATYYSGEMDLKVWGNGEVRLFVLEYGARKNLVRKQNIKTIKNNNQLTRFSFRVKPNSDCFNIALQMSNKSLPDSICLKSFCLNECELNPDLDGA